MGPTTVAFTPELLASSALPMVISCVVVAPDPTLASTHIVPVPSKAMSPELSVEKLIWLPLKS